MAFQRMRTRRYLAAAWRAALHTSSHRHAGLPMTVRELLQNTADIPHGAAVHGWVQSIRRMKNVCFATVADGSTAQAVQVVLEPEMAKGLTIGAAAKITGSWQGSLKGDVQHRELVATDVGVLGASDPAVSVLFRSSSLRGRSVRPDVRL
ncbi:hypothetical protein DRE_02865 [Drechslerella stenobrocha 248]|uniref:OB domain-containing protein n=1 Tax=Drechslerella stenobrocha 248 TaxID=1043628 RepID=W7I6V3_9PEZI|nr:hypothetical protein DRE_02865 [Drechslerella stenobrocha 248]